MRVLYIGQDPSTVDFSDPALPPGLSAEKIAAGIEQAVQAMKEEGWTAEFCSVTPDPAAALTTAEPQLGAGWDCVLFGGGLRAPPKAVALFEALVNAARRLAPDAVMAFNNAPEESVEAVRRACG